MKCKTLLPSPEQNFHLEELAMSTHCNCLNRNNHKMFQRHPRQNRHLECSILILNQMALNILHFRNLILENIHANKTKWSLSVIVLNRGGQVGKGLTSGKAFLTSGKVPYHW